MVKKITACKKGELVPVKLSPFVWDGTDGLEVLLIHRLNETESLMRVMMAILEVVVGSDKLGMGSERKNSLGINT